MRAAPIPRAPLPAGRCGPSPAGAAPGGGVLRVSGFGFRVYAGAGVALQSSRRTPLARVALAARRSPPPPPPPRASGLQLGGLHGGGEREGAAAVGSGALRREGLPASLAGARSAGLVRPLGPPTPLDAGGFLPNETSRTLIQPGWAELVGEAARALEAAVGPALVSLCLRGSVPLGRAVPGVSDVDFVVFHIEGWEPSGGAHPAEAVREAVAGAAARSFLCSKVDVRLVPIPAVEAAGLLARPAAEAAEADEVFSWLSPPESFQIKTQCLCLAGADLPRCLPAAAAAPVPLALPGVRAALARAAEAAAGAEARGDPPARARAYRWALKRSLRAAFELTRLAAGPGGGGVYTRDLYRCCEAAAAAHPRMEPLFVEAIVLYVEGARAGGGIAGAAAGGGERGVGGEGDEELFRRGGAVIQAMGAWLDREAAAAGVGPLAPPRGGGRAGREAATPLRRAGGPGAGVTGVAAPLRGAVTAVTLALLGDLESGAVADPLPPVASVVSGRLPSYDWRDEGERGEASRLLREFAATGRGGAMVLRGAAGHWPALARWDLGWVARQNGGFRGMVRVSPTSEFVYYEPALLPDGVPPPSLEVEMSAAEFALRVQAPSGRARWAARGFARPAPVAYGRGERCYMQAALTPALLSMVGLGEGPFAEEARMWVSTAGAVSPLHFDASASFLSQVRGRKRMLFWSPEQLGALYPYPDDHHLRRRLQASPTRPDYGRHPDFARCAALEASLAPGDVVFFPGRWAHYTESVDLSISVTCRCR